MNDANPVTPSAASDPVAIAPIAPASSGGPSAERVLWWVAFGVLTFAALAMLSLWN
ncbi:hypothetical protein [Agromyces sp. CCNWLW203]|uniref:hypothetical protein n=1 Tax=Agromyces sp. CCNWLW203 TaxID=3112842 RepID=UPI002F9673E9